MSTKLGPNVHDHKISDEFNYGTNRTRIVRVVTIYMPIRFWIRLIMGQIEPEHPELFALEFGKIAEYDIVYTLSSTNINQSAPNLVKMYVIIRSWMSWIVDLIGIELSKLSALELENLPQLTLIKI